ncbi:MAG: hypothetical protein NTX53_11275 [candidate division WOR-3 bacterium]|nr:hypothetical protein [candidate division WOR-3 bacterium]
MAQSVEWRLALELVAVPVAERDPVRRTGTTREVSELTRYGTLAACLFLLLLSAPSRLLGHTFVADTTGDEGDSLQDLVIQCVQSPGIDTILLHDGTYHLFINEGTGLVLADSIVLMSAGGAARCTLTGLSESGLDTANCVISGSGSPRLPQFISEIHGVTIRDGQMGGSFHGTSTWVDSCIIEYNGRTARGGGLSLFGTGSSARVTNCSVTSNWGVEGGGIHIEGSAVVSGCLVSGNQGSSGGGVYLQGDATVGDNIIDGNSAGRGGGVCVYLGSPLIFHNIISGNYAPYGDGGAGICCGIGESPCTPMISDDSIVDNLANVGGGILFTNCSTGNSTVSRCFIGRNTAEYGGGLSSGNGYAGWYGTGVITDCEIAENTARVGGALYVSSNSAVTVESCVVGGNSAADEGGAFSADGNNRSLTVDRSVICGNKAAKGGAFSNPANAAMSATKCFVCDNGNTEGTKSGLVYNHMNAGDFSLGSSNAYYNTFQSDTEVYNGALTYVSLANNFWWDTTEAGISALLFGLNVHTPYENAPASGAPGEPSMVDSVVNYASDWRTVVSSLVHPGPLYLAIYGESRDSTMREAAVALLRTRVYPGGIAVALVETDPGSGIYRGEAFVAESSGQDSIRADDIAQTVRVGHDADTIVVVTNADPLVGFRIVYGVPTCARETTSHVPSVSYLAVSPNPAHNHAAFSYYLAKSGVVRLRVYAIDGRAVRTLVDCNQASGPHTEIWRGEDDGSQPLPAGIYLVRIEAPSFKTSRELRLLM